MAKEVKVISGSVGPIGATPTVFYTCPTGRVAKVQIQSLRLSATDASWTFVCKDASIADHKGAIYISGGAGVPDVTYKPGLVLVPSASYEIFGNRENFLKTSTGTTDPIMGVAYIGSGGTVSAKHPSGTNILYVDYSILVVEEY